MCYSETEGKEEYSRRRVRSSAAERRVERRMQKPEMFSGNAQEAIMENPPESKARKGARTTNLNRLAENKIDPESRICSGQDA